jgi:hypothetical protein
MRVQQIELEEVTAVEVSDEALEMSGGNNAKGGAVTPSSWCATCGWCEN